MHIICSHASSFSSILFLYFSFFSPLPFNGSLSRFCQTSVQIPRATPSDKTVPLRNRWMDGFSSLEAPLRIRSSCVCCYTAWHLPQHQRALAQFSIIVIIHSPSEQQSHFVNCSRWEMKKNLLLPGLRSLVIQRDSISHSHQIQQTHFALHIDLLIAFLKKICKRKSCRYS